MAGTHEEIVGILRSFITRRFLEDAEPVELTSSSSLKNLGILTSLSIAETVAFVETQFGIEIDHQEMSPENFATLDEIGHLISRKMVSSGSER